MHSVRLAIQILPTTLLPLTLARPAFINTRFHPFPFQHHIKFHKEDETGYHMSKYSSLIEGLKNCT